MIIQVDEISHLQVEQPILPMILEIEISDMKFLFHMQMDIIIVDFKILLQRRWIGQE